MEYLGISKCMPPSMSTCVHSYFLEEKNKETSHHNQKSAGTAHNSNRLPRTSNTGIIYTDNKCSKLNKGELKHEKRIQFDLKEQIDLGKTQNF